MRRSLRRNADKSLNSSTSTHPENEISYSNASISFEKDSFFFPEANNQQKKAAAKQTVNESNWAEGLSGWTQDEEQALNETAPTEHNEIKNEQVEFDNSQVKVQEAEPQEDKDEDLQTVNHTNSLPDPTEDSQAHQKKQIHILTEEDLRRKMRAIDNRIRELTLQKNRLKYMLKKQEGSFVEGQDKQIETKECKCCGKDISKLCFRCEHLYCVPEDCPRKKKQVLNARMLEKMREKKGTAEITKRPSKRVQLLEKKRSKMEEGFDSEEEQEEEDFESDYSEENEEEEQIIQTRRSSSKPIVPSEHISCELSLGNLSDFTFKGEIYDSSSE